mgnify:FL=1
MKINIDKTFNGREELDAYVRNNFGEDSKANKDITLEMSQDEMAKHSLSESSVIYGAKIKKIK